jgi:hypothetical protein
MHGVGGCGVIVDIMDECIGSGRLNNRMEQQSVANDKVRTMLQIGKYCVQGDLLRRKSWETS